MSMIVYPDDFSTLDRNVKRGEWCNEFIFHYHDVYIGEKLLAVYEKQLTHNKNSLQFQMDKPWNIGKCTNLTQLFLKFNFTRSYPYDQETYSFKFLDKRIVEKHASFVDNDKTRKIRIYTYHSLNDKGDFDFLLSHLPGKFKTYFHLVTIGELIKHDLFDKRRGSKVSFDIDVPNFASLRDNSKPILWLDEFIFDYNDPDFRNKVIKLFLKFS